MNVDDREALGDNYERVEFIYPPFSFDFRPIGVRINGVVTGSIVKHGFPPEYGYLRNGGLIETVEPWFRSREAVMDWLEEKYG